MQHLAEQANVSLAAKLSMEKGKNIAQAHKYQAVSTIISGAMKTKKLLGSSEVTTQPNYGFKSSQMGLER